MPDGVVETSENNDQTAENTVERESIAQQLRWLFYGQYDESNKDQLQLSLVWISLSAAILSLTAGVAALLTTTANYPIAVVLFFIGFATIAFVWGMVTDQINIQELNLD